MASNDGPAGDPHPATRADHDDIIYPASIPFVLMHVACLAAIWTGIT